MSQSNQVIELLTDAKGSFIHKEKLAAAGSTIVPGDLVEVTAAGELQAHSVAGGAAQNAYALANTANAGTIDDVYTVGSTVLYGIAHSGQEANARVAVAAAAIPNGSPVESAGDGTVRVLAAGVILGYANEAVDNSGGATIVRLSISIA